MGKIAFIVNPHAGNGLAGRKWPLIKARAKQRLKSFQASFTSGPGDAVRLTRQRLREGAETIVCVGGDGTFHEVINGFMNEDGRLRQEARVGLLPGGTGCDFARTVRLPADPDDFFDLMNEGQGLFIDLGRLHCRDFDNQPCLRYFHNIVSFGIGGEVVARAGRIRKLLPPRTLFLWAAFLSLCRHGGKRVRLRLDGGDDQDLEILNIAIANGRYHGGGMCVAPAAVVDDGLLNITVIGNLPLSKALLHLPKLYDGRIGTVSRVSLFTGRQVEASSAQPLPLDVDGELPGVLPLRAEIVPRALFLIAENPPLITP